MCKSLGFRHVSCGDIHRRAVTSKTPLGDKLRRTHPRDEYQARSDAIHLVLRVMFRAYLADPMCAGILIDGCRSVEQAKGIEEQLEAEGMSVTMAITLTIDRETALQRVETRLIHPASGRVYNLKVNPPKEEGKDDVTGEPLVARKADKAAALGKVGRKELAR